MNVVTRLTSWKWWRWLPYLILAVAMIIAIALKQDYYIDEIFSYGLANSATTQIDISNPGVFQPAWEVFRPYVTVKPSRILDYFSVWRNQTFDVHPPFYYLILHFVSSFGFGHYSRWWAGIINIAAGLASLYFADRLLQRWKIAPPARLVILLGLSLCPGLISAGSFLRMYVLLGAELLLITDLLLARLHQPTFIKTQWWHDPLTWVITIACLTHYYAFIYLGALALVTTAYCWSRHQQKQIIALWQRWLAGGILAVMIFPPMIRHIIFSDRGGQTWLNLTSTHGFHFRLELYWQLLTQELFGNGIWLLLIIIFGLGFIYFWRHRLHWRTTLSSSANWWLVFISSLIYFVVVAIAAVFTVDRYMQPLYVIVATLMYAAIAKLSEQWRQTRWQMLILTVSVAATTIFAWRAQTWPYIYWERRADQARAAAHEGLDCLFLYQDRWTALYYFQELLHYRSVTFIPVENNEQIRYYMEVLKHAHIDELVVAFGLADDDEREPQAVLNKFLDISGSLVYREKIWQHSPKSASYYVSRQTDSD